MKNITPYHAKIFAYELTQQLAADDIGKLTASLQDAQVDLNPWDNNSKKIDFIDLKIEQKLLCPNSKT